MAIDDNTSYELTGAQVKDLVNKIKAKAADNIFVGATSAAPGSKGLVPQPQAGDEGKALHGDGTWKDTTAKLVEMSYGESNAWAKFIAAYNAGSVVYCRASSNANPATGSQTRKAFMAYVNNATSPTNVEFQYVRSQSSKTDSQQCDQVFVYKLTNASGGTWTVESRNMAPKIVAGTGMTSTFTTGANATITLNAEQNYSTSEVDTKVKWVNNKTIYRKALSIAAGPDSLTGDTEISLPTGVSQVLWFKGYLTDGSSDTVYLGYTNLINGNDVAVTYDMVNNKIVLSTGTGSYLAYSGYIVVDYTKS